MKRIKSLLLTSLIVISSIAGITTVSAATSDDTTANLYISDTIEGTPAQTPAKPAVTANVGDIIEVSVTAKAKKDVTNICSIDIRTYFNQPSANSYEMYDGDGVLKYTNTFHSDGSFYKTYSFPNASTVTNPDMETYPSNHNYFIYTMSSAYNQGDFTSALTLYSFTLEVVESGDAYINTAIRDLAHAYPGQSLKQENDLLDVVTVVNVVKQAETPTTETTTEPTVPTETEPVTDTTVPTETEPVTNDTTPTATEPIATEPTEEPTTLPVTNPTDNPTTVPATDPTETTTEAVPTVPVTEPTETTTEFVPTTPVTKPTERPTDEPTTSPETVPDVTETTVNTEETNSTESTTDTQATNPTNVQATETTTPTNNSTPDTATPDTATPDTTEKNPTNTVTNNNGTVATGQTLPVILIAVTIISAGICVITKRAKSNINR